MRKIYVIALLLLSFSAQAQYYLGLQRPGTKWMQLKNSKVQVVYAPGLEAQARRVASLVTYLSDSARTTVGSRTGRITIALRNQTAIANGFVAIAPFRSEFFLTPPQNPFGGSSDWLDLLTVHEYRHVQQYLNARVGITKFMSILFGQNGWGFMSGMALPRWYFEGDAVAAETGLTESGRGRMPSFDMEYRALLLHGRRYNYEKASSDSYRHFVTSHYQLGYNMIAYGRKHYGADLWAKVMGDAARYKGIFFPFSRNLKKHTGLSTKKMYNAMLLELDSIYRADANSIPRMDAPKSVTNNCCVYTDYEYARYIDEENMLVLKSGFDHIPTFYTVNLASGKERKIWAAGFFDPSSFTLDLRGDTFVWAQAATHHRWGAVEYNNVWEGSIRSAHPKKLNSRKRRYSPALSPDASKIAVVEVSDTQQYGIFVYSHGGTEEKGTLLPNPQGYLFTHLRWMNDTHILAVARKEGRNAVVAVHAATGAVEAVTEFTAELLSFPEPSEHGVLFTATHTGISNIFAVKKGDKAWYQITSSKTGAFAPAVSPSGKKLAYSEFEANGHVLTVADLDPEKWKKWTGGNVLQYHQHLAEQEGGDVLQKLDTNNIQGITQKRYFSVPKLLNIHSWNPVLSNADLTEGGIDVSARDKMSNFSGIVGYRYNVTEATSRVFGEVEYGGLLPVFKLGVTGQSERVSRFLSAELPEIVTDTLGDMFVKLNERIWTEQDFYAGVKIPLALNQGAFFTLFTPFADWHSLKLEYELSENRPSVDERINTLETGFEFATVKRRAKRQIYPRLGLGVEYTYRGTLGSSANSGQQNLLWIYGYLPSPLMGFLPKISKNHGIYWSFISQTGNTSNTYQFRNYLPAARGYAGGLINDRGTRFSVNYGLPLLYPDLPIGPFAFIQRVKANLFYDVATYHRNEFRYAFDRRYGYLANTTMLRSFGAEITFDLRALRLLDIDMGFRYSYLQDAAIIGAGQHNIEFILLSITP